METTMRTIHEQTPTARIKTFMDRKAREYPELRLHDDMGDFEDTLHTINAR
jgi:hypothetical protein